MGKRARQIIAATLIVRNEEAVLARCLTSLQGVVDEIHVHDTGSTDATAEIAASFGAHVTHGHWAGDFAAARNAALEGWTADWALSIDADEQAVADPEQLRRYLVASRAGVLQVDNDNTVNDTTTTFPVGRLFRPRWAKWTGGVHEQLIGRTKALGVERMPRQVLRLAHTGYASPEAIRAKCERNLAIAQAEVDALAAQGSTADPARVARALVDLGRSQLGVGQSQAGIDTCETVRELFPGTQEWLRATDLLAGVLTESGMPDVALLLAQQLREAGADDGYCDWLSARALVELGEPDAARQLLVGVSEFVNPGGHRVDLTARSVPARAA